MPGWRRTLRALALVGASLVPVATACSGDDTPKVELGPTEWKASVYETVLRQIAFTPAHLSMPESEKPVVYLATSDGSGISADVQILVVNATKDEADLRFADDVKEVVLDDEPDNPVKDDGLLVTVSPLPEQSNNVELAVGLYFSEVDEHEVDVDLMRISTVWTVTTSIPAD